MEHRRDFLKHTLTAGAWTAAGWAAAEEPAAEPGMPADPARELPATAADLGTLFGTLEKLVGDLPFQGSFLTNRFATLNAFKNEMRSQVLELLRYRPKMVAPEPELIERREMPDHIRERILFSTGPHLRVPAYVLIPKKLTKPAPAMIDLHSHGGMFLLGKEKVIDLGANHPIMTEYHERNYEGRPTATALVRRGYVVISIDALMFGERRVLLDADRSVGWDRAKYSVEQARQLNQVCRSKESTIVKGMTFAGLTWPGVVFWDDMRTIDYLITRPEVDAKRIGCLGISMGGYRTAFLAGLDERIAAACVVGFMSTVRPMMRAHLDTHSFVHFVPGLHQFLDLPDVVSMMAPKPLMIQQCSQDRLFPLAGMQESIAKIGKVYEKAGVKDRFAGRFYDAPHKFTIAMQEEAFDWFDRVLKT